MPTVLFVHGTGTRDPSYSQTFDQISAALRGHAAVEKCYWGGSEGTLLRAEGVSIPRYASTRQIGATRSGEGEDPEDYAIALWKLLADDPLFELRLIASAAPAGELAPGQVPPKLDFEAVGEWEAELPGGDGLRPLIARAMIGSHLAEACEAVSVMDELEAASAIDPVATRTASARAIVAATFLLAEDRDLPAPARTDPALRDELVSRLAQLLAGASHTEKVSARGWFKDYVAKPLLGMAGRLGAHAGTHYGRRRRGAVMDGASPAAGDILLYQARGEGIRNFIKARIAECEGPVVLFAHSLGGIACVDLLIQEAIPQVKSLVTVGSQAPYFYEIGALHSRPFAADPPESRLPPHFPPLWQNFYDLRDFLSFVAQPIFGSIRVADFRVDNRLAFPEAHSGYFSNPEVWEIVIKGLPKD